MGKSGKVIDWEEYRNGRPLGTSNRTLWDDVKDDDHSWGSTSSAKGANKASKTAYKRCYETHKPLKIEEYLIYGGSCSTPMVKDADIYVGFERGMEHFGKDFPWIEGDAFQFLIADGHVPPSVDDFKKLLKYLSDNLKAGKKIHIGCIGGHGRTGLVMSALVCYMTGDKNSTEYVRKNYCEKAVESHTQIDWLHKHFGIDKVKPSKAAYGKVGGTDYYSGYGKANGLSKTYGEIAASKSYPTESGFIFYEIVKPVRVKGSVWGF